MLHSNAVAHIIGKTLNPCNINAGSLVEPSTALLSQSLKPENIFEGMYREYYWKDFSVINIPESVNFTLNMKIYMKFLNQITSLYGKSNQCLNDIHRDMTAFILTHQAKSLSNQLPNEKGTYKIINGKIRRSIIARLSTLNTS